MRKGIDATRFDWRELEAAEQLSMTDEALEQVFWAFHPRFRFFKTLPPSARLLDVGAGAGGLHFWRDWGDPARPDIELFGVDRERGEHMSHYAAWQELDLDLHQPDFGPVRFDGFLASHVIEHLADPASLLAWMGSMAKPGARVYLEWPDPLTLTLPPAEALRARGFAIQAFCFHDDATHRWAPSLAEAAAMLDAAGFALCESGRIQLGLVAQELMARGVRRNDLHWRQMGLWAQVGWAAYAIGCLRPVPVTPPGGSQAA
jgi:SAM-dependent methyltransferase